LVFKELLFRPPSKARPHLPSGETLCPAKSGRCAAVKFACEFCGYETGEHRSAKDVIRRLRRDGAGPVLLKTGDLVGVMCRCPKCKAFHVKNL